MKTECDKSALQYIARFRFHFFCVRRRYILHIKYTFMKNLIKDEWQAELQEFISHKKKTRTKRRQNSSFIRMICSVSSNIDYQQ